MAAMSFLIIDGFWRCLMLLKRGPKAPSRARRALGARRAPQPSAGARRRGAEHPELLVFIYLESTV